MKPLTSEVLLPSRLWRVVCSAAASLPLIIVPSGIAQELTSIASSVVASTPKNQIVATVTGVGYANSSDLAVSPDGAYVYVANDEINSRGFADPPRVISAATNTVVASITDKSTTNVGIAITPDASTGFVTNNFEFQVSVFSVATNTVTSVIPVGYRPKYESPEGLAISPDGSQVYVAISSPTGTNGGYIAVIDVATLAVTNSITIGGSCHSVVFTSDGTSAFVLNEASGYGYLTEIDTASGTVVRDKIAAGQLTFPGGMVISPDGATLYLSNQYSDVIAIETSNGTIKKRIHIFPKSIPYALQALGGLGITTDGKFLYVSDLGINSVTMVDTATNARSGQPIQLGTTPDNMVVTPNDHYLYVGSPASAIVTVIDITH
jgi:DNA-binding beta-propeller fold protein YncE